MKKLKLNTSVMRLINKISSEEMRWFASATVRDSVSDLALNQIKESFRPPRDVEAARLGMPTFGPAAYMTSIWYLISYNIREKTKKMKVRKKRKK